MGDSIRHRSIGLLAVAVVALATFTSSVHAQRVRDGGGFFSAEAVAEATAKLDELHRSRGASVVVETFPSAPPEVAQRVAAAGSDQRAVEGVLSPFVRQRGPALQADVYVMAIREPGHLRINVDDRATAAGFTPAQRDEVNRAMRDAFRQRAFDRGLLEGVSRIDGLISTPLQTRAGPTAAQPRDSREATKQPDQKAPVAANSGGMSTAMCFMIGVVGLGVLVVIAIVRGMSNARRNQQHQMGGYGTNQPQRFDPQTGQSLGGPAYGQPGYGQPAGGGAFGRGLFGGVLGGLLGGYMADRAFGNQGGSGGNDAASPTDPGNAGTDSGGSFDSPGDFGGGDSGGDFGGGGDSGGDF